MRTRIALQLSALIGVVTATAAGGMIWLVLTRPADVATSVAQHDYGTLALAVAGQVAGWLHTLLRFL
jgi:hypothetical protein